MDRNEVEWTGYGWRIWRVGYRTWGGLPMLRNPWANAGVTFWWDPRKVQVAECFWPMSDQTPIDRCNGYLSSSCTCGIRSIASLRSLAAFLAGDGTLRRDPSKAGAVGLVRIGGRVQRRNPGLAPPAGYQRSEFAELVGPLYVSPSGARWADGLEQQYRRIQVVSPEPGAAMQGWLAGLAEHLEPNEPRGING